MQTPNTPPPQGTLAKETIQLLMCVAKDQADASERLKSMMRLPSIGGHDKMALAMGSVFLDEAHNTSIDRLRQRGGLLFYGQPKALAAINQMSWVPA